MVIGYHSQSNDNEHKPEARFMVCAQYCPTVEAGQDT